MSAAINLRQAKSEEAEKLSTLSMRSKAYWGHCSEFMEACRKELTVSKEKINKTPFTHMVAELGDEVVGYYALKKLSTSECELEALFVEPALLGKGIGRKLMQHAKHAAVQFGATTMIIQGDPNTTHFYRAVGGKRLGERESESIPGRYLPLFLINLDAPERRAG